MAQSGVACAGGGLFAAVDIPKGAWHAEGEVTDRVVYIVSVREPVPLLEAIIPREPKGPLPRF